MTRTPDTTPVIVGVGHATNRPDDDPGGTVEPARLLADAIGAAAGDAGLMPARLAECDSLDVVNLV